MNFFYLGYSHWYGGREGLRQEVKSGRSYTNILSESALALSK